MKRLSTNSPETELETGDQCLNTSGQEFAERGQGGNTVLSVAQSESFLTQCARIAHLGYAIWDESKGRDVFVSEEFARFHGLSKKDYLETVRSCENYLKFVVPEDREKFMAFDDRFDLNDTGTDIEYRIMRPDGGIRHLHLRAEYVSTTSGQPAQSIVVIQIGRAHV